MVDVKKLIRKLESPALVILAAFGLTAVLMNLEFNLLEANLYDFRMSKGPQPKPDQDIVLITIDDYTSTVLNDVPPLPLDYHARFLEILEKARPKAIGYLVDTTAIHQANPDEYRAEASRRFVSAANRIQAGNIPILLGTAFAGTGEILPPFPLNSLPHALAIVHKDGNVFSEDKVTRRALTYLYDNPVFHLELAQRLGYLAPGRSPRGTFHVAEADARFFFFRYHGNPAVQFTKGEQPQLVGAQSYPRYSFADVLHGKVPASKLTDKILLVGTLLKENPSDFAFTPYSKNAFQNPKLVVHANILDSVLHDQGVQRVPSWINWGATLAVITFVLWWVLNSTPLYGVFATLSLAAAFLIAAQLLFLAQNLWIRESQPLVGIFLGYYLAVPYRLIQEYKKRWDYQRKNELLVQVEELKRNFLSLVTHDLKTPVARIQGLAEVLLRKSSDRLPANDKETVQHIIDSTEELNRFISSILELNRIESNRVHLVLESKDVNLVIERCLEGFHAQARARQIRVVSNLEPLFPIKLDVSLISKVLNNLIDNALKYSPTGSEIAVESREVDNWVEISIRDQGIGLTEEERKNLFTRFYRAKNDTTARIAGTGLGLYLTKYFVEAHRGRVAVESELGKGSTFKILLPVAGTATASPRLADEESFESIFKTARTVLMSRLRQLKLSSHKEKTHV